MNYSKLNATPIQTLLKKIQSIKETVHRQPTKNTADELAKFENQFTLDVLETCLSLTPQEGIEEQLIGLLSQRWERIRKTSMCYTESPFNIVNCFCLDLAKELSPLPADEEAIDALAPGQGPYFLLMPSLVAHRDIYLSNIHQLSLHQFVLADGEEVYIPIEHCLEHFAISDSGEIEHMVSKDNHYAKLLPSELARLSNHSLYLQEYLQAVVELNKVRVHGVSFEAQLQRLAYSLYSGGAHQGGSEFNSGSDANVGIIEFHDYWENVPELTKQYYYYKYPRLKNSIQRLTRPSNTDYSEPQYCVELIAQDLDDIIYEYKQYTKSVNQLLAAVEEKKKRFIQALPLSTYPIQPSRARPPRVLPIIYSSLDEAKQQDILRHKGAKNAWMYALEHDQMSLREFAQVLDERERIEARQLRFKDALTPLMYAARDGIDDAICFLIEKVGVDVNVCDHHDFNALMYAVHHRKQTSVEILLARGADVTARNYSGKNALDFSYDISLNNSTEEAHIRESILIHAASLSHNQQNEMLGGLSSGLDNNILQWVSRREPFLFSKILPKVIEHNHAGILKGQFKVNASYLHSDIQNIPHYPVEYSFNVLNAAVLLGSGENVHHLLDLGALDIEEKDATWGRSALIWGAKYGKDKTVSALLARGADHHSRDHLGNTALHHAVNSGYDSVVQVLLANNVDLNARNKHGENALEPALTYEARHHETLGLLLIKMSGLTLEKQEEMLRRVDNGVYKSALTYIMIEKPEFLGKLFSTLTGSSAKGKKYLEQIQFIKHFRTIRAKWREMEAYALRNDDPAYRKAAIVAKKLTFDLVQSIDDLFKPDALIDDKLEKFSKRCKQSIHDAMPLLEQHRGWRLIFTSILLALTFPISLPLYAAGLFFSMKTDSAEKLQAFDASLGSVEIFLRS